MIVILALSAMACRRNERTIIDPLAAGTALPAMVGKGDQQVHENGYRSADHAEHHRVDDASEQRRDLEQLDEISARELRPEIHSLAPVLDEGPERDAADGQNDRND